MTVLIPNERGLDTRALGTARAQLDEINVFMSASETHNRKNVNRSIAQSLAGWKACWRARAGRACAARR